MKNSIEDRIKNVMSAVLDIPTDSVNNKSSSDNIISWDSLMHMNLVLAIEEEFDISFNDDEIIDMINFKLIYETVKTYNS